jgi:glycosyltransferase involved in cell wall biosynthesis
MVVVEAMALGLPVFVTAVGDLPWLVRDGIEGRISPYGETARLAESIIAALGDDEVMRRMGANARRRIESLSPHFTDEAIRESWRRLLRAADLLEELD